jgi:hypothetical protein
MFLPLDAAMIALTVFVAEPGVPTYNVKPSCDGAARQVTPAPDPNLCIQKEQEVRAQIEKQWNSFVAADRAQCMRLSSLAGQETYTELLTCLEMARDVRNLHKEEGSTNASGGMKPAR